MAKVNQEEVLRMLQAGKKPTEIAKVFKVTRQAIGLHRAEFIRRGLLTKKIHRTKRIIQVAPDGHLTNLDESVEALIKMAGLAAKVPGLEEENWQLKNKLAATQNALKVIQKRDQEREDQASRYQLAIKQGEVNPPLVLAEK
jgi:hypothetical protein